MVRQRAYGFSRKCVQPLTVGVLTMSTAVTNRQVAKQNGAKKVLLAKAEKESLAKYNADGQALVKRTIADAGLSMEQVCQQLSVAVVRGFNDFTANNNSALLWFILQEAINCKHGLDLFAKLERTFHTIAGAGTTDIDKSGRHVFDKKMSIITISKKENISTDENGKTTVSYSVNIGLKNGNTRSDLGKVWNKRKNGELKGKENVVAFLLEKYNGKPETTPKPKKERTLADIVADIASLHDGSNDKDLQRICLAMLDAYKKELSA